LKPKQGQLAVTTGSGFSIAINFPDSVPKADIKDIIDAEDAEIIEEDPVLPENVLLIDQKAHESVENEPKNDQKSAVMAALESIFDEPEDYAGEDIDV
jgi:hypothetical protein